MKFNFDGKEYDSEKLSNNGKVCLARLQHIKSKKDQLSVEFGELDILDKHYVEKLKEEILKETKVKADVM